jgi:hypothetical protein
MNAEVGNELSEYTVSKRRVDSCRYLVGYLVLSLVTRTISVHTYTHTHTHVIRYYVTAMIRLY